MLTNIHSCFGNSLYFILMVLSGHTDPSISSALCNGIAAVFRLDDSRRFARRSSISSLHARAILGVCRSFATRESSRTALLASRQPTRL